MEKRDTKFNGDKGIKSEEGWVGGEPTGYPEQAKKLFDWEVVEGSRESFPVTLPMFVLP